MEQGFVLRRTSGSRDFNLESTDRNAEGRENDVETGTSRCPLFALALLSRIVIMFVDNIRDLYISAA